MRKQIDYFLHSEEHGSIIKGELIREENATYSSNRNFKGTVFRLLMDDEEHLLSLFNALEGTCYQGKDLICINTMKGVLFNELRNDLSFSVKDWYLSLIEHQSIITENSPTWQIIYLGRILEQILDSDKLYRRKLVRMPIPRPYVLYNGQEDFPQEKEYRLSKAFRRIGERAVDSSVEFVVKVININPDKKHPILEKCPILKEYSIFIDRIRGKINAGVNRDVAVKEAIGECMEEGILQEFLNRHGREVYSMMLNEITYDDVLRVRLEEAREDALEQGMEQGEAVKTRIVIQNMLKRGIPDEEICVLAECTQSLIDETRNQEKG
ncbi:hypothetical protein NE619_09730 [Anaerovorax odorimutans]|uniref:Transposase/invertase (TIGR01784 family) n=1 Tax=Anaerovorax odorimutans TaxID=109327 RepID=A0ABT1RP99_9FIRM|nr:hypothetical protein [Anaerovorax odorimutans]MCQ4637010.1 hypothetical protein [Anaerovorax odorimutans]